VRLASTQVDVPEAAGTPAAVPGSADPADTSGRTNAAAQTERVTISGIVRDPHGGVIPGATVTATAATTALARTVTTDVRGQFALPDLAPGEYDVVVSLSGFKTWRSRVSVPRGQPLPLDVRLEMGGITEVVELRGNTASPPPPAVPIASRMQGSATALFDAAKALYQQGRFVEAERMTEQALGLVRAAMRENPPAADPSVTPAGPTPIRVGGSIREPRKVRHVNPIYPQDAWAADVSGYVIIEAVVAADGSVRNARVLGGEPMLQQAALDAVQQWQYTPTLLNGVPVEVVMNVTVHFRKTGR
jgi:TonB family protein